MSGVLVVGESLVDVVTRADGTTSEHPGGSPANVALGLARLGRETYLLTHLGDDERGRLVADHLEASGVVLVDGSVVPGRTSVARAVLDADGSATYEFDLEWALPARPLPPNPLAVHTGSIAAVLQPGAATVERIVLGARHHATVTYDPNLRPDLMGDAAEVRSHVEGFVAASDVVKLSEEDAAWLAPATAVEHLLEQWLHLGPSVVVLTRGGDGALALCREGDVRVDAPAVTVADTVGAGDAFMSGLIDGLWSADLLGGGRRDALLRIEPATLTDVLSHAVRVAAVTVSRPGADPPTRADLPPVAQ
ncbi:MAG: carbohydrate kinase family protein [Actinomycetota bacterium]